MKLKRYEANPILKANPDHKWEAGAVFNCSVVNDNGVFRMVYRAVNGDYISTETVGRFDNYISSIGYAVSSDGKNFEKSFEPLIKPDADYDKFGCEDPRITKFGDTFYIFYTAIATPVIEKNTVVRIACASTKDFITVKKHGIVGPNVKSKAGTLLSDTVDGQVAMFLTAFSDQPESAIQVMTFDSIEEILSKPKEKWENFLSNLNDHTVLWSPKSCRRGPEVGASPLKTDKGWLFIFCDEDCGPREEKNWSISAALLDFNNPRTVVANLMEPILFPQEEYELKGDVPRVAFPSGAVIVGEELYVYYGGADKVCCLATCNLQELLDSLE